MISMMLSPAFAREHPAIADEVAGWLHLMSPAALAAELSAIAELPDLGPELGRIRVPVTLIAGELDVTCPVSDSEAIAAAIDGARLHVVGGAGHAVWVEAPGVVAELVRDGLET